MSAPGGRKKRIGSRRGVPSQRERSTAEEFHVTDSTSTAQHHMPEEGTDSLNVLSKPDNSTPETQHPLSPEVAMNRRKLGSSRRNKGRSNMKGTETESYVESEEEVGGKTRGNKTFETMQTSQAIQPERQEEVSQGSKHDMSETPYYSEVNPMTANCPEDGREILIPQTDHLQKENETKLEGSDTLQSNVENAHVAGVSDLTSRDVFKGDASIEGINSVSESHVELAVLDSITPEVTTDKSSPGENIENESSVKHAMLSSPKEKLLTNEEVSDAQLSEDAELKEMQDMHHRMDYSSDSMICDATENSVTSSGILKDQAEIRDTDTSDLSVKTDDFASEQEVFSLGGKQDEHPTKERYLETIEEKNEDCLIHGSSNTGSVDLKLGQRFETKGQIEDAIKLNAGPTAQLNKEGVLSQSEKSSLSPQPLTSDINAQFDSQPQDNTVSVDESSNTGFSLSGNRRKMGSSRRNKGRQRIKEPQEEDSENIRADEVLEKIKMSETMKHEESSQGTEFDTNQSVTHDSSMFSMSPPSSSSDVQNLIETNYLETDLESLIPKGKNLQEDQEETDSKGLDECDTLQSEKEAPEEEVNPADIQEVCQIDYTSESLIDDATGNLEIGTGSLIDQNEIIDTYQPVLMVKSADDSSTKQEVSDPDDKQDEHQTDELNLDSLTQENENYPVNDSKQKWNKNTERENSALGHMFEAESQGEDDMKHKAEPAVLQDKGVLSESEKSSLSLQTMPSEISVPLDSQPQDNAVSVDEPSNTGFSLSGNRRKMGSSRRNKGRQRVKESQEEDSDVQDLTETNHLETDLESLIPKTENVQEDKEETDSKVFEKLMEETLEGLDTFDTVHSEEFRAAHYPEDAEKKAPEEEVNPTDTQEVCHIDYTSESGINDATENTEIVSESLMDQIEILDTYQSELMVKSADDSSTKQEVSDPDDKQGEYQTNEVNLDSLTQENEDYCVNDSKHIQTNTEREDSALGHMFEAEDQDEDDMSHETEPVVLQDKDGDFSEFQKSSLSVQTMPSEISVPLDSQPQDNAVSVVEPSNTGFSLSGNRRKMGSSHRNKGRQRVKESQEEDSENTRGDEVLETIKMSETMKQEESSQRTEFDTNQSVTHAISIFSMSPPGFSSDGQNLTQINYPETDLESVIPKTEHLQEDQEETDSKVFEKSMEEILERLDTFDTVHSEEFRAAHHPEDAEKNAPEEAEVNLTDIQEVSEIDYTSESTINDATKNHEVSFEVLIDQTEIIEAYQSVLMVEGADDSSTKQEVSDSDDKQGEHQTDEINLDSLTQESEDYPVNDSKQIWNNNTEREDSALGHMLEAEGQDEDDMKHKAEPAVLQDKGVLSEFEKSSLSVQTMTSEISVPLDSQPQDSAVSVDEPSNTGFSLGGNRRKMGSSRRNKGRQRAEESQEADSDIQNLTETNYPETDLESLIPKTENVQEDKEETDSKVFEKSMVETLEGLDTFDTVCSEEFRDAQHPEDAEEKGPEEEVNPTDIQEVCQIDYTSESAIADATGNLETGIGSLIDPTEITDAYQSVLMVESADDSSTKQEVSDSDDKQGEHQTDEINLDSLTQENEDYPVNDSKQIWNNNTEREDSALGHMFEAERQDEGDMKHKAKPAVLQDKGVLSEFEKSSLSVQTMPSEISVPLDSQPQDNAVSVDEPSNTGFSLGGNRRKMGSSRRNKGRQRAEESQEEDSDVQNVTETKYPETDLESLIPQTENVQEDKQETDSKVVEKSMEETLEGLDTFDTVHSEEFRAAHHVEDAEKNAPEEAEVKPTDIQEVSQNDYTSESRISDATENLEVSSEVLIDQIEIIDAYQSVLMVESADDSSTKQEVSDSDDKQGEHQTDEIYLDSLPQESEDYPVNDSKQIGNNNTEREDSAIGHMFEAESQDEHDMKHKAEPAVLQDKGVLSEIGVPLDSQPQDNAVSVDEPSNTGFSLSGNRRKMGSSRRNKGKQRVKESQEEDSDVQNLTETNYPETDLESLIPKTENVQEDKQEMDSKVFEKSMEETLEGLDTFDTVHSEEFRAAHQPEDAEKNAPEEAEVNLTDIQEVCQIDYTSESAIADATGNLEIGPGSLIDRTEILDAYQSVLMVESADDSSTKQEVSDSDDKQGEHQTDEINLDSLTQENEDYPVNDSKQIWNNNTEREDSALGHMFEAERQDEDDMKHKAEPAVLQDKGVLSEFEESSLSVQTMPSEISVPPDSQPQDNAVIVDEPSNTGFSLSGNRRKMGSSRRNKGRQRVKESQEEDSDVQNVTETNYPETDLESLIPQTENVQEDKQETDSKVVEKSMEETLEGLDTFDTVHSEEFGAAHHVEDAEKKAPEEAEVKPTDIQEVSQNDYTSESRISDATENLEVSSEVLIDQIEIIDAYQSVLMVESADDSSTKQEVSDSDDKQGEHQTDEIYLDSLPQESKDYPVNDSKQIWNNNTEREDSAIGHMFEAESQDEHDMKHKAEPAVLQDKGVLSEIGVSLDSQPQDNAVSVDEPSNTGFSLSGNRRKMGSSRRNKGKQRVKESQEEDSDVQNLTETNYPETDLESLIPKTENVQEDKQEMDSKVFEKSMEETLEGLDTFDTVHSEEFRAAHHPEDAEKKAPDEAEVNLTDIQEVCQIDYTSESAIADATGNLEIGPGSLIDPTEIIDAYQSVLMVESADDSSTKQEVSDSDDKQGEHQTDEINLDSLTQENEDYSVNDSKQIWNNNREREHGELGHMFDAEGQDEKDMRHKAEPAVLQDKGVLSEFEKISLSVQTIPSEISVPPDSQPQDNAVSVDEPSNTGFSLGGNRRKMGSSRRNKGRQRVKESLEEDSDFQNLTETNYPETDLESLIPKTENVQEGKQETDSKVFQKSMEETLEGLDTFDTVHSEEFRAAHHPEDAEKNAPEEAEVNLTDIQDVSEIDYTSESTINDATKNHEVSFEVLTDQTEIIEAYQSVLMVEGADDSSTKQEVSDSDDKQGEHQTDEIKFDSLPQENEDYPVNDSKQIWNNNTEREDSAIGHMFEAESQDEDDMKHKAEPAVLQDKGVLSEIGVPLDSQPQDNAVSVDEPSNTVFSLSGNRRKIGSSRRNKGRQRVKESQEEDSDVQNLTETNYPETDLESLIPKAENVQEDKQETDSKVFEKSMEETLEGLDTFDTVHSEEFRAAHHPEDAEKNAPEEAEVNLTDIQEVCQIDYTSESAIADATGNLEIGPGSLIDPTEIIDAYQSVLMVESADDSSTKQEVSDSDDKQGEHQTDEINLDSLTQENEDYSENDSKQIWNNNTEREHGALGHMFEAEGQDEKDMIHKAEPDVLQDKGVLAEFEKSSLSVQTMPSEISVPLDSQPQDSAVSVDEPSNTGFSLSGNRRKMGSSRRNKGRQRVKESQEEDSDVQNLTETNYPETDLESLIPKAENVQEDKQETDSKVFEKSMEETLEGLDTFDTVHSEEFRAAHHPDDAEKNAPEEAEVNLTDIQKVCQIDYTSESAIADATGNLEIGPGSLIDPTEIIDAYQSVLMVESADDSSTKQEVSDSDDKQGEHQTDEINLDSLTQENEDYSENDSKQIWNNNTEREHGALGHMFEAEGQDEKDMIHKAEPAVLQDKGVLAEFEKSSLSVQTMPSEISVPLDSQPQDSAVSVDEPSNIGFSLGGNRRKMGSSRRNKGRQRAEESQEADSDIQNLTETNYPETDLESLIPKTENVQEDKEETDSKVFEKSMVETLEGLDTFDTVFSEEFRAAQHPEDTEEKAPEEEVNPTDIQEVCQIDYTSESTINDATENLEVSFEVLIDQTEIIEAYQSVLMVESADDSSTKQEVSDSDDKQGNHQTDEINLDSLTQENEDYLVNDSKQIWNNNTEREDSALGHMFEAERQDEDDMKHKAEPAVLQDKGVLSEFEKSSLSVQTMPSEISVPLDSQPQDNAVSVDEPSNTGFSLSGNRRKMGSSRRNKGRQRVKESQEEDSDVQNLTETNYPETDLDSLISKTENLQEDQKETDSKVFEKSMEETLEGLDTFDTVHSEEFRDAHYPEDAEDKAPEEEVKPTDIQEVCQIDHTSESGIADAIENLEIGTRRLMDQTEIIDTYQSVLMVESAHDSSTKQEVLYSDDKQGGHQTDEINLDSLTQENEDYPVNDSKQIWNNNTERENSALGHTFEAEGQDEDDMKRKAEPAVLQDKGVLSEFEKSSLSVQTMPSEIGVPLDSQSQDNAVSVDEPSNTGFSLSGNRRKMGSSRRNKGRQRVKESQEEDSDVQNLTERNYPETDLESLIPQTENVQEDKEETDSKVFEKSMEETVKGLDTYDTVHSEEFRAAHHPEDAEEKASEDEVKLTDIQEVSQIVYTSESGIVDATGNLEISTRSLIDQTEIIDAYQSELMVESADDSSTKQEVSDPDDKQGEHQTDEINLDSLTQENEDYLVNDSKQIWNNNTEREDSALGQMFEAERQEEDDMTHKTEPAVLQDKGVLSEFEKISLSVQTMPSEISVPLDSQPQGHTGFSLGGNRRKMGSSRRNKGRQHVKESQEEDSDVQNLTETNYAETDLESLILKTENVQEVKEETDSIVCEKSMEETLKGLDTYDTVHSEEFKTAHHPEDTEKKAPEEEVNPTDIQEVCQIDYTSEGIINDTTGNLEVSSEILIDQIETIDTYQSELMMKSTDDPSTKQEVSDSDDKQGDHQTDDVRTTDEQKCHQEREELLFETEDRKSPLQMFQSETYAAFDSQPHDSCAIVDEQSDTVFNQRGNRRKLGSSRRIKTKECFKDPVSESYYELADEVGGNTRSDENSEKTNIPTTIETEYPKQSEETVLEGMGRFDTSQTEEENAHINTFVCTSGSTTANVYSSPTIDQLVTDQSHYNQMPDEKLSIVCSVTDTGSKERDECTELSQHTESPITPITTDKNSPGEQTEVECIVEQETFSSPKEALATIGEQHELFNLSEVGGAQHSEDVVNKLFGEQITAAQTEEIHQVDYTSAMESKSSLQTLKSETSAHLDSHPQSTEDETHTGPNPLRNRRKLGSSRRTKGRQYVRDSVLKTYNEPEEEVSENASGDEAPKMTNMSSPTETARQEEIKDLKDNSTFVTSDITENVIEHEGYSTIKTDLMQSPQASDREDDMQNILHHDDTDISRSSTADMLDQEEASQVQNTGALSCDKGPLGEQIQVQQTDDVRETVGYVAIKELNTEAAISIDVQGPGQDEMGEKCEESTDEVVARDQPADVSYESGFSMAVDASDGRQEKNPSDHSENSQVNFQHKRRKMGSTRKSQLKKKQEGDTDNKDETKQSDFNTEAGVRSLDKMDEGAFQNEHGQALVDTFNREQHEPSLSVYNEGHELQGNSADMQSAECNLIPGTDNSMVLLPEQSPSHNEEVVNSVAFLKVTDIKDGERNVDISSEPTQLDDFTSTEMQITSRRNRRSVNQPQDTENAANTGITVESTESFGESTPSTLIDEGRPENVQVIQSQDSDEQNPDDMNEGARNNNAEMQSPNKNSTHRRRKMGSTRKILGSRTQGEDLPQKGEVVDEATETETTAGVVATESGPGPLQLHAEHKDDGSKQRKEKVFETVEHSQVGESQLKPLARQTVEENPISQDQPAETENDLTPNDLLSTSPKEDTMSESAYGGRRRKMGSHRKSRGHQPQENQSITDVENENDASIKEEGSIKAAKQSGEKPSHLDKISEAEESEKEPSSDVNISREHSAPVRENTPVQPYSGEIRLSQESQKQFSLAGNLREAGVRSTGYNVVMIGDSSVGKTSFMKRAQSGKFSLDLPASVGLDSCKWTVVVDGKPLVLHIWDTAGQERFRSITRQIFHKAQAFLLMYDITSTQSFSAVSYWANCIQESAAENVIVLLLGNKSDRAQRQVKLHQGEVLAKEYNFEFMECSAATGENVVQSLETVARMLSQRFGTSEEATVLPKEPGQKKSSGCC